MLAPYVIDTEKPSEVAKVTKEAIAGVGGEGGFPLLDRLFSDITAMFEGRYPGYQAIDMEYHDFEHTLQATVCLVHLLQGRSAAGVDPVFSIRDWELAVMAVLLHDTGFLKEIGDNSGTGAKYTFVHETRSCRFAKAYLSTLDLTDGEIEDVCSAIMCTGPRSKIGEVAFRRAEAQQMAFMLVTADYLAQISASDYLDKLPRLYREFDESFAFNNVPLEQRPYQNLRELLEKTAGFWYGFVRPVLDEKVGGVYNYLAPPGQPNRYIEAVEANLTELTRRLETGEA